MNAQKLIDLKEEIADKKIEHGVLENKQTELLDTLKEMEAKYTSEVQARAGQVRR